MSASNGNNRGRFEASEYQQRIEPFTGSFVDEMIQPFVIDVKNRTENDNDDSPHQLLDVGCGTGIVALKSAKLGFQVTASDISKDMINQLERRIESEMITTKQGGDEAISTTDRTKDIRCVVADGETMPFPEASFGFCVAHFSVIFFPSPLKGLQKIHQALQPGGRMVMSAWGSSEETPAFCVVPDAFADVTPLAYPGKSRITGSPKVLMGMLQDAGFVDIQIEKVTRMLEVESASAYCDRFFRTSPKLQNVLQSVLTPEIAQKLKDRVKDLALERGGQDDGSIRLPATAYLAYGRKPKEN